MSSDAQRRGFLCPRCRQRFPYRRHAAGEWYTCVCGEHFVVPEKPRPEPKAAAGDRVARFVAYGLGGAFLVCIPMSLIAIRLFFAGLAPWVLGISAAVGFLIGGVLGERGVNAIGRFLRSMFERRV
jgi:hypothetical protein